MLKSEEAFREKKELLDLIELSKDPSEIVGKNYWEISLRTNINN